MGIGRFLHVGPARGVGPGSPMPQHTHYEATTTRDSEWAAAGTGPIGDGRLRLVLLKVDGGHVVARATVYAAGARRRLAKAMVATGRKMADGVADFIPARR